MLNHHSWCWTTTCIFLPTSLMMLMLNHHSWCWTTTCIFLPTSLMMLMLNHHSWCWTTTCIFLPTSIMTLMLNHYLHLSHQDPVELYLHLSLTKHSVFRWRELGLGLRESNGTDTRIISAIWLRTDQTWSQMYCATVYPYSWNDSACHFQPVPSKCSMIYSKWMNSIWQHSHTVPTCPFQIQHPSFQMDEQHLPAKGCPAFGLSWSKGQRSQGMVTLE